MAAITTERGSRLMRKRFGKGASFAGGDMTPMIDMTFQLIAFFMVVINFAEADQSERIRLPDSELAKPPDKPPDFAITLQLTSDNMVIFGGEEFPIPRLPPKLLVEKQVMIETSKERTVGDATIIIRADADAQTGKVQKVIKICQNTGFEKFHLRAKQKAVEE